MATESYNAALALRKDIGEANPMDSVTKGIGGIFGGAASGLAGILIYIVNNCRYCSGRRNWHHNLSTQAE